jgi:hypothetical protein
MISMVSQLCLAGLCSWSKILRLNSAHAYQYTGDAVQHPACIALQTPSGGTDVESSADVEWALICPIVPFSGQHPHVWVEASWVSPEPQFFSAFEQGRFVIAQAYS